MQFLIDIALTALYFSIFLLICAWSWRFWMMYINQKYLASLDWVMLEIKLPREITKSPLATETAITGFLQSAGASTVYARNFEGKVPHFGSLEIASIEGVIHFYIRVQRKFKPLMEANFYAQYPDIEIIEAQDYTKVLRYHHLSNDVNAWGITWRTGETWKPVNPDTGKPYGTEKEPVKMKADFLPIKTYVDFTLDKDPKEEFKIDPITQLLEAMGALGKGEHMWYQILIQDESVYNGSKMPKLYVNSETHKHMSLKEMADERKKQIRTSSYVLHGDKVYDDYGYEKPPRSVDTGEVDKDGKPIFKPVPLTYNLEKNGKLESKSKAITKKETELTQEDKDELEVINKKMSKALVVCVVRLMYIAKKENFDGGHIPVTLAYGKPYTGANKFIPTATDPYDYPWQKQGGRRISWRTEEMFEEYVEREGFFPHVKGRDSLDEWEDRFFWSSSMKQRKLFRMIYEGIFYPFEHPSSEDKAFTLNLEEVATLWHLPGAVAGTPTLPRIDSTKGIAPVNLPI
jgi:hypothetical protein